MAHFPREPGGESTAFRAPRPPRRDALGRWVGARLVRFVADVGLGAERWIGSSGLRCYVPPTPWVSAIPDFSTRVEDLRDGGGSVMSSRREFMKHFAGAPLGAALAITGSSNVPSFLGPTDTPPVKAWIDVREFGARGDGRADDSQPIQAAIDSLQGRRGIIFFPAGTYRCEAPINVKRAQLLGSGVPGATGGGGTTLRCLADRGLFSSVEDNYGFEVGALRIVGSGRRQQNGQVLVDFTGQNYPRMRDCRISQGEIGMRLSNGERVECHYGSFFNVHFDRCYIGVDIPGTAHSHKFFAGRFWDCVYAVRNVAAGDIAFFGTEFESDYPLWHPVHARQASPITLFVGTRQESDHPPLIETGSFTDLGSYWSGYRRPPAFGVRDGQVVVGGQVITAGIRSDTHPVKQNLLRNPGLIPDADEESIPGWQWRGRAPAFLMGPFGRVVRFELDSPEHALVQEGIRLPAGRYLVGFGFHTEGNAEASIVVESNGRIILDARNIPANYQGGLVQRPFTLDRESDDVRVSFVRRGASGAVIYYYAPFLVPTPGGEAFLPIAETGRPSEVRYGTAPPRKGAWQVGDIVYNLAPRPGGYIGWTCVEAGSPGTWKGFGRIES